MTRALYRFRPIATCETLARTLQCSVEDLRALSLTASAMYRSIKLKKKDGSPRYCFDAFAQLKVIQGRINTRLLHRVQLPVYLTGGIKGRSHLDNASLHAGSQFTISEDIQGFFPSASSDLVFDIWFGFFGFAPEVANLLTGLTTKDGCLPEGARTSTNLANLVFWRSEPTVYEQLAAMGLRYSRHVDDVTISSRRVPDKHVISSAVSTIAGTVLKRGMRLKRKKHRISFSGQRREATGLLIDRDGALPSEIRNSVRSQVFRCEQAYEASSPEAPALKQRAQVRVGQLKRFHPKLAESLRKRLELCSVSSSEPYSF